MKLQAKLTPGDAIAKLRSNDPGFTSCNLNNSAVLQLKSNELLPDLFDALAANKFCRELHLQACNVDDRACEYLATALSSNTVLAHLNLEGNKISNGGAQHLAQALAENRGVMLLNLLNQKGTRFGDQALTAFLTMFDKNVTLLKIIWCAGRLVPQCVWAGVVEPLT